MTVAQGDELTITGNSGGRTDAGVAVWIFGRNYFWYDTVQAEHGGRFTYDLPGPVTRNMAPGEYSVIIQHPMTNGEFDIWPDRSHEMVLGTSPWYGAPVFRVAGPGALQGPAAAGALISALQSQFIDDTCTEYSIFIQNPKITIWPDSLNATTGATVSLAGTTNLAPGSRLLIEVTDERFGPAPKGGTGEWYGYSGTTTVYPGATGGQEFAFTIPAGTLQEGDYQVLIQAVSSPVTASGVLQVSEPVIITPSPALTMNITPTEVLPATKQVPGTMPIETGAPPLTKEIHEQATKSANLSPGDEVMPVLASVAREPSVVLGFGILLGLCVAGLIAALAAWIKAKKREETEIEKDERDDSAKESG